MFTNSHLIEILKTLKGEYDHQSQPQYHQQHHQHQQQQLHQNYHPHNQHNHHQQQLHHLPNTVQPPLNSDNSEIDGKFRANGIETNNNNGQGGGPIGVGGETQNTDSNLENETKSISSLKSVGSNSQER